MPRTFFHIVRNLDLKWIDGLRTVLSQQVNKRPKESHIKHKATTTMLHCSQDDA